MSSVLPLLVYSLFKTTRRLTFDILEQSPVVTYMGEDDGEYFKFIASNGYEVISRSRMDIQTERLWLLGAKYKDEFRSGSMVFSSNEKRDAAYANFKQAIDEWAVHHDGFAVDGCSDFVSSYQRRTLLQQYDLDQSSDYQKGFQDGRLEGFEVGQRYAKEAVLGAEAEDPLQGAVDWFLQADGQYFSVSNVQRTLRIGYNRASRLAKTARDRFALKMEA